MMFKGAPEPQPKIPPNCQFSTTRDSHPGALPRKGRFGPNGNAYVPLLRMSCVLWKLSSVLLSDRFRGFKYWTLPSRSCSPNARLHVYDVWLVKPCAKRLVSCHCIE